jgi:FecR-like protein
MRLSLLVLSFALCLLLSSSCSKAVSRATAVMIFSFKGRVVFGNGERNELEPVTLKSRIQSGDIVRSSDGTSIDLALIPAALAQLIGGSEIKIDELSIAKDGNQTAGGVRDRTARIRLNRGKVIVLFNPGDQSTSQFAVTTGQLTIKPDSDCLFCVWTDGKTTRVTCAKGNVNTPSDAQAPVTMAAGYFQEWPTTRKTPVPATEDASAQIDITESLEAEQRLQDGASVWQNRRPF